MDDQHPATSQVDPTVEDIAEPEAVERAVLADSAEGRAIAAAFVASFGAFVSDEVRPVLRQVAEAGGEPQLLVNGLAQMLREVADSMEFPVGDGDRPAGFGVGVDATVNPTPEIS